jgi:hypothetical protein
VRRVAAAARALPPHARRVAAACARRVQFGNPNPVHPGPGRAMSGTMIRRSFVLLLLALIAPLGTADA